MLRYIPRGVDRELLPGFAPWASRLLQDRGIDTPEKAETFLHPSLSQLHDPFLFRDMEKAVDMITEALAAKAPICVWGDYDVDGICASSILLERLRMMDADVCSYIPARSEGYGVNRDGIRALAEQGVKLLITVDCGITNHEEVRLARSLGMKVIVTDHHEPPEEASPADAVMDPKVPGCGYPCPHLCGAGMAFKLVQALCGPDAAAEHLELAAIATVADLVMLVDENRVIVRLGLEQAEHTRRAGLRQLMLLAGVHGPLQTEDISFKLAPRINAGGRLEDARQCVTMLTGEAGEAGRIAEHLDALNKQRQAEQAKMLAAAEEQVRAWSFRDHKALIVRQAGWNKGIIGLVAGKLQEALHYPVIALSEQEDGTSVGSCRSIEGVHLHGVLTECARRWRLTHPDELFIRFGGHAMAAGLTIRTDRVEDLTMLIDRVISDTVTDLTCYIPYAEYDCDMALSDVTLASIEQMDALRPTGYGMPEPVFRCRRAEVQSMRRVGADLSHLKLSVLEDQTVRGGIAFGLGREADVGHQTVDILFAPVKNEFRGHVEAELQVKQLRGAEGARPRVSAQTAEQALAELLIALARRQDTGEGAKGGEDLKTIAAGRLEKLLATGRGVLLIAHEPERAAEWLQKSCGSETGRGGTWRCDPAVGTVEDRRGFDTVLLLPQLEGLEDWWDTVVLLDGDLFPGEAELIRERCPGAEVTALRPGTLLPQTLRGLRLDRETLGRLYQQIRAARWRITPDGLAEQSGLSPARLAVGLEALSWSGLIAYKARPWSVEQVPLAPGTKLPAEKSPVNAPVLRYLDRCLADLEGRGRG